MQSPTDATLAAAFTTRGQVAATFRAAAVNVLSNPGFESGSVAPWALALGSGPAGNLATSTTTRRTGTRSLAVIRTAAGAADLYPTTTISATPGETYRFTAYAKAGDPNQPRVVRALLTFYDTSAVPLGATAVDSRGDRGDRWVPLEAVGTAPAGTAYAELILAVLGAGGAGEVHYFDDVEVAALGYDIAEGIESITVRRELVGDLPTDVSLLAGAVSASCEAKGDLLKPGPHAGLAADRADWPGAPVSVSGGYGTALVPLFGGVVRTIAFDERDLSRKVTLMERSDQLRAPVTIPTYGSFGLKHKPRKVTRYPTNVSAAIVAALHASDIRVTPLDPQEHTWCSLPFAFGMLPDVGSSVPTGGSIDEGTTWLTAGAFAPMPSNPGGAGQGCVGLPAGPLPTPHSIVGVSFWVQAVTGTTIPTPVRLDPVGAGFTSVTVDFNGTTATARFTDGTSTFASTSRPCAAGWHLVRVWLTNDTNPVLSLSIDNGVASTATSTTSFTPSAFAPRLIVAAGNVQAVQGWSGTNATRLGDVIGFSPEADVDTATLEVDLVPAIDGQIAWDLCKEVAAAELGMVGFNETGRFYFKSRASLRSTTPVATWDVDLVDTLAGSASIDAVRDRATCQLTRSWLLDSGTGSDTTLTTAEPTYLHGDVLEIPPGTTDFYLDLPFPIVVETHRITQLRDSGSGGVGPTGAYVADVWWVLSNASDGTGSVYNGSGVTGFVYAEGPTRLRIRASNVSGSTKYVVWPGAWTPAAGSANVFDQQAGGPGFGIMGRGLVDDRTVSRALIARGEGDRTLTLDESPWRTGNRVRFLLDAVLADLSTPRLQLEDITVPADLRWQIGDVITLADWRGRVPSINAQIIRLRYDLDLDAEGGMAATVSLRALPA